MKNHPSTLLAAALALSCGDAFAQGDDARTTTFQTPQGTLVVHTSQPPPASYGPPPAFAQLDRRHAGWLDSADADAYPPLANDFIHADSNRDGRVSKAEYARWAASQ